MRTSLAWATSSWSSLLTSAVSKVALCKPSSTSTLLGSATPNASQWATRAGAESHPVELGSRCVKVGKRVGPGGNRGGAPPVGELENTPQGGGDGGGADDHEGGPGPSEAPRPGTLAIWRGESSVLPPAHHCPPLVTPGEATYEICINLAPTELTRGASALSGSKTQGLEKAPRAFSPDFLLEEALLAARHESMEVHDSFKSLTNSHNCGRDRNLAVDPTSVFVALTLS